MHGSMRVESGLGGREVFGRRRRRRPFAQLLSSGEIITLLILYNLLCFCQVRGVSSTGEAMSENPQQESKMLDTSTFTADQSEAKQTAMAHLRISSANQNDRTENSDAKAEAKEATATAGGGGGAGDEKHTTGAVDVATVLEGERNVKRGQNDVLKRASVASYD